MHHNHALCTTPASSIHDQHTANDNNRASGNRNRIRIASAATAIGSHTGISTVTSRQATKRAGRLTRRRRNFSVGDRCVLVMPAA